MGYTKLPRKSFKESFKETWSGWDFKGMVIFFFVVWNPLTSLVDGVWGLILLLFGMGILIFTVLYSWLKPGP